MPNGIKCPVFIRGDQDRWKLSGETVQRKLRRPMRVTIICQLRSLLRWGGRRVSKIVVDWLIRTLGLLAVGRVLKPAPYIGASPAVDPPLAESRQLAE